MSTLEDIYKLAEKALPADEQIKKLTEKLERRDEKIKTQKKQLAARIAVRLKRFGITCEARVKSLGIGMAAGGANHAQSRRAE